MAASNKQFGKTTLYQQDVSLGEGDDSQWDDAENQQSPALGEFELPDDSRLHQFGEFGELIDQSAGDGAAQTAAEPTIPSLDASNDNSFLDKEIDSQLLALLQGLADRRLLLAGLVCSLIFHLIVGGVLINLEPEEQVVSLPMQVVQVRLLPENPLLETLEEVEDTEEIIAEVEEVAEPLTEELIEEPESVVEAESPAELIAETVQETGASAENIDPAEPDQPLPMPSLDVIQSAIQQDFTEQQLEDRSWASTCTSLQRQSGVVGCVSQEEPNFAGIEQSPESRAIYEFHNPVVERSRTERSISTIATNSALLAANLATADIPEGLGDLMMTELESTITFYSNSGNRALNHMNEMVDQSDAALISRSLFDPWVRLQIQKQQQRRYYTRQDLQRMAECSSLKIFVLAATELEKFADCTTREGNLLFRLLPLLL